MDKKQPRIDSDGNKFWYLNGDLHREDGPAAECANGDKEWWLNDRIHRTDGPAIVRESGVIEWWLNSVWLSFDVWLDQNTGLTDEEKVMFKLKYG
jgi:hypothetical protein